MNQQLIVPQYTPEGELHDAQHRTLASQEYVNNALTDFQSNVNLERTDILFESYITPGTSSVNSSIFTPPDDSLLVVVQEGANLTTGAGVSAMTLTSSVGGVTFTQQVFAQSDELGDSQYVNGFKIWTAPVTIGEAMNLTLDCGATNIDHFAISVVAYTGYDVVNPIGTKGSAFTDTAGVAGSLSFNLPVAPRGGSEVLAVAAVDVTGSAGGVTPGDGWTEIHDFGVIHGWGAFQTQFRRSSTSPAVSWDDLNTAGSAHYGWAVGAIEIRTGTEPIELGEMPSRFVLVINKSGGVWPGVPTTRSDVSIVWRGANPPPPTVSSRVMDEAGMLLGVDMGLFY